MSALPTSPKCSLCGEPMPKGEEMFQYHGYSGDCPKSPRPTEMDVKSARLRLNQRFNRDAWRKGKFPTQGLDYDIDQLLRAQHAATVRAERVKVLEEVWVKLRSTPPSSQAHPDHVNHFAAWLDAKLAKARGK